MTGETRSGRPLVVQSVTRETTVYVVVRDRYGRLRWVPWEDRARDDIGVPLVAGTATLSTDAGEGACLVVETTVSATLGPDASQRRADGTVAS